MDSQFGYWVIAPKHCEKCGKALEEHRAPRFDRLTGERLGDELNFLSCPDGHEQWGKTLIGLWGLVHPTGGGEYELKEAPLPAREHN